MNQITVDEIIQMACRSMKAQTQRFDRGYLVARIVSKTRIEVKWQSDFGIWSMSAQDDDDIVGVCPVFTDTTEPKWEMNVTESMTNAWNEYWRKKKCQTA